MKQNEQNKMQMLKEKFITAKDWVMDHTKIIMPIVLVVCVLATVLVAVNANQKEALQKEAEMVAATVTEESNVSMEGIGTPQYELEENAHQDVNNIIKTYYEAQAEGDVETISSLNTYLNDIEIIRVQEMSKYIESYPAITVYTKPGLSNNSYVAYVYSEVKFTDVEQELPGMQTFYIEQDESGAFHISDGTYDETVWNYIKEVTLQDDVVDLNNKVVVEYNDLLANDEELSEFIAYLKEKINEDVGEILAQSEHPAEGEQEAEEAESVEVAENTAEQTASQPTTMKAKATDVVNIRTSDSETADKIDRAQIGQEFVVLEQRGNGWSKVEYEGQEAFIKSDYLEIIEEEVAEASNSQTSNSSTQENADTVEVSGTVKVIENVKVRKGPSTDSDSLGTVYVGTELDLVMKQADGWTKIKYQGQIAYVKSDYVE